MHKIRCILADDEPLALQLLQTLLQPMDDIEIVAACSNGKEALSTIMELGPELVFMDIEMPDLSGFDVVRKLQPESMPLIIFTTAFDRYAIDAFEIHAVDYVLKPLSSERLELAIDRAKKRITTDRPDGEKNKSSVIGALDEFLHKSTERAAAPKELYADQPQEPAKKTFLIRDGVETLVVRQDEINWVDAAGDYMCIHVGDKTHVTRTTMKKLEEQLDQSLFVRIHRSTLVNVSRVKKLENLGKGDYMLHMGNDCKLKVSRHYRARLMEHLI